MPPKGTIGLFISPEGSLLDVPDTHIGMIIRNPETFGLTKQEIQRVYDTHKEPLGIERRAREEIITQVVKRGWIRIRRYPNRYWSVTVNARTPDVKATLRSWAKQMLCGTNGFREADRYMPVRISPGVEEYSCCIGDLANGSFPGSVK